MFRKSIIISVVLMLLNLSVAPLSFAKTGMNAGSEKERKFIQKLRTNIEKQGVGEKSTIQLKLTDGTKLNGYISEINDDGIIVVSEKTGSSVPVAYPQIKQAKGNNWSAKKAITIAVILTLIIVPIIIYVAQKDRT